MTKKTFESNMLMTMPHINIDGKDLVHCMFKYGSLFHRQANADLQPTIIALWKTYNAKNTTDKKKAEVKEALLYWEAFLQQEISYNFTNTTVIKDTPKRRKVISAMRNARDRDILVCASYKRAFLDDTSHANLANMGDGKLLLDAEQEIKQSFPIKVKIECSKTTEFTTKIQVINGQTVATKIYRENECKCAVCQPPVNKKMKKTINSQRALENALDSLAVENYNQQAEDDAS